MNTRLRIFGLVLVGIFAGSLYSFVLYQAICRKYASPPAADRPLLASQSDKPPMPQTKRNPPVTAEIPESTQQKTPMLSCEILLGPPDGERFPVAEVRLVNVTPDPVDIKYRCHKTDHLTVSFFDTNGGKITELKGYGICYYFNLDPNLRTWTLVPGEKYDFRVGLEGCYGKMRPLTDDIVVIFSYIYNNSVTYSKPVVVKVKGVKYL